MKIVFFLFFCSILMPFSYLQNERDDLALDRIRLIGPGDAEGVLLTGDRSVELDLRGFYGSIQSFVSTLDSEKRIAGPGWSIERSDFPEWKSAKDKAIARRQELAVEAKTLKEASDDFWKKVIDSELAAEKELCEMLQSVLPPSEQDCFLFEHSKELGVCVLTSSIFRDKAKLEPKVFDSLLQTKRSSFAFLIGAINGKIIPPGKFRAIQRAFIAVLSPEQFDVLLVLTGRKDSRISLEEHMSVRVTGPEREQLLEAIPGLKKYVTARTNE